MTRAFSPSEAKFDETGERTSALVRASGPEFEEASSLAAVQEVPDSTLMELVQRLNRKKHLIDAELLLCLSEFDFRKLYREAACSSFFEYLTKRLGYSEDVAYRRMWCARLLREYPVIHEYLRSGQLHMAALLLLKPLLTQDNHRELLQAAVGKSKREVEKLVAARNPQPDAPTQIRRLPRSGSVPSASSLGVVTTAVTTVANSSLNASRVDESNRGGVANASPADASLPPGESNREGLTNGSPVDASRPDEPNRGGMANASRVDALMSEAASCGESSGRAAPAAAPIRTSRSSSVMPLSASSYRVVFTASERLKQKFDRAGELTSHSHQPSDLPSLLERALDLLIAREERRRFGSKRSRRQHRTATPRDESTRPQQTEPQQTESQNVEPQHAEPQTTVPRTTQPTTATTEPQVTSGELKGAAGSGARRGSARGSAHIPAAVRREVWERDGGQCAYVNASGERCQSRHFLQFDHRIARVLGGAPTVANLRLRCAAHNALAAEQILGVERVKAAILAAHQRRKRDAD